MESESFPVRASPKKLQYRDKLPEMEDRPIINYIWGTCLFWGKYVVKKSGIINSWEEPFFKASTIGESACPIWGKYVVQRGNIYI
jgi:hypothetical protein